MNNNVKYSSKQSAYFIGIMWFSLSLVVSISLDVFQKYLGQNLHSIQITFLRFLFATLILLPFMAKQGKKSFVTKHAKIHFFRGMLLFGGIALWCYGLTIVPISAATTTGFTIPLFTLILAIPFLKEKVGLFRWGATIAGFVGVMFVFEPTKADFNPYTLLILLAAAMFAMLDIFNKKYVVKESMLCMLFYTALFTMLLSFVPTVIFWQTPSLTQLCLLFLLGCGANLILYCLLKAFSAAEASALAPFRYIELILSAILGFIIFKEIPSKGTCLGALVIVPATFFVIHYEAKKIAKGNLLEKEINAEASYKESTL